MDLVAHKVHSIASTVLCEGKIVGHVHAAIYIGTMPGSRRDLHGAAHNKAVVDETLLR